MGDPTLKDFVADANKAAADKRDKDVDWSDVVYRKCPECNDMTQHEFNADAKKGVWECTICVEDLRDGEPRKLLLGAGHYTDVQMRKCKDECCGPNKTTPHTREPMAGGGFFWDCESCAPQKVKAWKAEVAGNDKPKGALMAHEEDTRADDLATLGDHVGDANTSAEDLEILNDILDAEIRQG